MGLDHGTGVIKTKLSDNWQHGSHKSLSSEQEMQVGQKAYNRHIQARAWFLVGKAN
jgi:hypothetical protein